MSEHKPGTVARITVDNGATHTAILADGKWWYEQEDARGVAWGSPVTDVRPLVVLDLEFPDLIVRALRDAASNDDHNAAPLRGIADQIADQVKPAGPVWELGAHVRFVNPDFQMSEVWRTRSDEEHRCIVVQNLAGRNAGEIRVWDTVANEWFVAHSDRFVAVTS